MRRKAERLADGGKLQQATTHVLTRGKFVASVCTPQIEEAIAKKWRTREPPPEGPRVRASEENDWLRRGDFQPYQVEGRGAVAPLFRSAKTVDRTAGPGFGGIRYSHLYEAVAVGTFTDRVLDGVAGQINLFLAGKVPLAILPLLTGGRGGITLASMDDGEQDQALVCGAEHLVQNGVDDGAAPRDCPATPGCLK